MLNEAMTESTLAQCPAQSPSSVNASDQGKYICLSAACPSYSKDLYKPHEDKEGWDIDANVVHLKTLCSLFLQFSREYAKNHKPKILPKELRVEAKEHLLAHTT